MKISEVDHMWKRMPFFPVGYTNFKNAVSLAGFFTTVGQVSFASFGWDRSSWGQGNCMQGSDSAVIQLPPLHSFSLGNNNVAKQALKKKKKRICFPDGSVDKESTCNAADQSSIPGSGRFPGEGNGNPLQHSCLGNPMDRGAWRATVHGVTGVRNNLPAKPPPNTHL